MAASMMEILKQIQHDLADQKEYMRNLHVINRNINEKYNLMARKIDEQQVTMERLEQQVRKNNKLLFGYDEKEVNIEDKEDKTTAYTPGLDDKEKNGHQAEQSEKNIEENQLKVLSKVAGAEDTGLNCEDDNRKNDEYQNVDSGEDHAEEVTGDFNEEKELTPITYISVEQIKQLIDNLKQNASMYQSEIKEIKELIMDFVTTETADKDNRSLASKQETIALSTTNLTTDLFMKLNSELKNITDVYHSDMKEIKDFIKGIDKTDIMSRKEIEIADRKQETVQISPNYLSTDQISKLNAELKQIADKYQATNIFPIVEVIPGPAVEHCIMKRLTDGVRYHLKKTPHDFSLHFRIKLGMRGFERSKIQDLLTEYPEFGFYDVIKEGLRSTNEWSDVWDKYNWDSPHNY